MNRKAGTFAILALVATGMLFAVVSPALAGGFQISVETPDRSSDQQLKEAVLIARTYGCHQPADAKLSASAEGFVDGARKSLPIELRSIGSGVYAINRQWPSEGKWVITLTGAYNGMTSSVLVDLGPNGSVLPGTRLREGYLEGVHARGARRTWVADDIDSALRSGVSTTSKSSGERDNSDGAPFGTITWLVAALGASAFTFGLVKRTRRGQSSGKV